eukprot:754448-Prorocentrum_minimum.AAC.1
MQRGWTQMHMGVGIRAVRAVVEELLPASRFAVLHSRLYWSCTVPRRGVEGAGADAHAGSRVRCWSLWPRYVPRECARTRLAAGRAPA